MSDTAPDLTPYRQYPANYPRGFVKFHDKNGWIYEAMVREALELKAAGFAGVGVRYLFERQRYTEEARAYRDANPGILYGLDNNFAPWYGRLLESQVPELKGFFRLRKTAGEIAAADPRQGKMEFD